MCIQDGMLTNSLTREAQMRSMRTSRPFCLHTRHTPSTGQKRRGRAPKPKCLLLAIQAVGEAAQHNAQRGEGNLGYCFQGHGPGSWLTRAEVKLNAT